jgi:hypothetical protein
VFVSFTLKAIPRDLVRPHVNLRSLTLRLICKPTGSAFRPTPSRFIGFLGYQLQVFSPNPWDLVCFVNRDTVQLLCTDSCFPSVPVLGIFTKLDRLMEILGPITDSRAEQDAANIVQRLETVLLRRMPHPPAAFIQLRGEYIPSQCQFRHLSL